MTQDDVRSLVGHLSYIKQVLPLAKEHDPLDPAWVEEIDRALGRNTALLRRMKEVLLDGIDSLPAQPDKEPVMVSISSLQDLLNAATAKNSVRLLNDLAMCPCKQRVCCVMRG